MMLEYFLEGFLITKDGVISRILGLKDQCLAKRCIHKTTITAFDGDRKRTTLAGESAGAISVNLHLLNAKQRFHQE